MGYLSNNDLTVDAILTKAGRAKLAAGQGLDIAKFALADDEIDYTLYEPAHPLGSAYYDYAIKNIPVIEASPDESQSMRFKIFTADKGLTVVPRIANLGNTTTIYTYRYNTSAVLTPKTFTLATTGGVTESYTVTLGNNKLGFLSSMALTISSTSLASTSQGVPQTIVTTEGVSRPQVSFSPFNNLAIGTYTSTITITGNMSGATVSIPVTITVTA
jgi:hypothetical protein